MTEVTRDMAIMTYLLAFPLQCFYCDQKIGSCLLLSSARCATPGERGQKLRHGILVEGSSMHLSKSNINRAWKHLLLMNRSSFWGTWDNWDSDTEASLQKTNSAGATVAIQYSHRCILQDVNVSDSYHPRIFQDIRNFSPFQNSPRSPERKQSLTQRGDVLRRISGRYCWETELKPQCLPRIVDESTNPQVVVMRKTAIFFFKWMDQIVMSMIFPNKPSYKPIVWHIKIYKTSKNSRTSRKINCFHPLHRWWDDPWNSWTSGTMGLLQFELIPSLTPHEAHGLAILNMKLMKKIDNTLRHLDILRLHMITLRYTFLDFQSSSRTEIFPNLRCVGPSW